MSASTVRGSGQGRDGNRMNTTTRVRPIPPPQLTGSPLTLRRQLFFWPGALLVFIVLLWLLSDVLLPFIVGMGLAYLLDPLVRQAAAAGPRTVGAIASSWSVLIVVCIALALIAAGAGAWGADCRLRPKSCPQYVERLQKLVNEQVRPGSDSCRRETARGAEFRWDGMAGRPQAGRARCSARSGGRPGADVGAVSLIVIAPIVAFYLLLDWDRMIATSTTGRRGSIARRCAALHEMDPVDCGLPARAGLVLSHPRHVLRGRAELIGLNFGSADRPRRGDSQLRPLCRHLTGFLLAVGVAIAQFWPEWTADPGVHRRVPCRSGHRGQRAAAVSGRQGDRPASGLADVRPARLRLPVRLCRTSDRGAGRRRHRRADRASC